MIACTQSQHIHRPNQNPNRSPMRASLSLLRSLSFSLHHRLLLPRYLPTTNPHRFSSVSLASAASYSTLVKHSVRRWLRPRRLFEDRFSEEEGWDYFKINEKAGGSSSEGGSLEFDAGEVGSEMIRHMGAPLLEVKGLEELPEQWRRSELERLCKELPALKEHKLHCIIGILNVPERKWLRLEDATYMIVHFMGIGENKAAYWVYKWMKGRDWYRFDFALATKLADSLGKDRNFDQCGNIFHDIIIQGHMPNESTFHILIVAYLSASVKHRAAIKNCLDKACGVYNCMIQLGGYQPHLNLHNSLFRVLISKLGSSSKYYLKQAEFIFHNLVTSGLEIQKDIYVGLIWLHSYQDTVNKKRVASLRKEMRQVGIEEGKDVLMSVLRVCSKEGDVEEAERICLKLLDSDDGIVTQAFVYKMLAYVKIGEFTKSLDIFREMRKLMGPATVPIYHELIDVLCKAENKELAESVLDEFIKSGMKPPLIMPSYINITNLDLGMRDRLHLAFSEYENILVYNIYLASLIKARNVEKAEEVFNQMQSDEAIGINARSCTSILIGINSRSYNSILSRTRSSNSFFSGHLSYEDQVKVENIFDLMLMKDIDVERLFLSDVDYILMMIKKGLV